MIELAVPGDAEDIREVETRTWYDTYVDDVTVTEAGLRLRIEGVHGEKNQARIGYWRAQISAPGDDHQVLVARVAGRVAGYAAPGLIDGQWRVGALYVLPGYQGQGIGGELLAAALGWIGGDREVYARVAEGNSQAMRFYAKHGFTLTGTRFPDDHVDASIPAAEMSRPGGAP